MGPPPFTNLIIAYNSRDELPGLLADLRLHAPGSHSIVIDNASPDGTADLVQADFLDVHVVRNATNVGYARAVNQGFDLCASEYVLLLNPDIRVTSPRLFKDLQEALERAPEVAVAAPLQYKMNGGEPHLNFTWSYWSPEAFKVYLAHLRRGVWVSSRPIPVRFLNAGCLFIRRSAFEHVGGLNEKYFLYGEEPDLFLKLWRHGFECRLLPSLAVIHHRERSLQTIPASQRLRYKLQGGWNIADAVARGMTRILLDRLTGHGPPQ